MNNPWDPPNLAYNIDILGKLYDAPVGTKLSEADKPRYSLDSAGKSQGIRRFFTKSITDDNKYRTPLKRVFEAAMDAVHHGAVTLHMVEKAYQGMKKLQQTYNTDDEVHRKKLAQICNEIHAIIEEGKVVFFDLRGGEHVIDLLHEPRFHDTLAMVHDVVFEKFAPGVGPVGKEQVAAEHVVERVFEKEKQAPTHIPKLTAPYVRTSAGVCEMFVVDSTNRLLLGHTTMMCEELQTSARGLYDAEKVRQLYEGLGGDEAMLFTVSQLCNQVCMLSLPSDVFGHATLMSKKSRQYTPLLRAQGQRLMVTPRIDYQMVSPRKDGAAVIAQLHVPAEMPCQHFSIKHGASEAGTLLEMGVNSLQATFAVELARKGHSIEMKLTQAKIHFNSSSR